MSRRSDDGYTRDPYAGGSGSSYDSEEFVDPFAIAETDELLDLPALPDPSSFSSSSSSAGASNPFGGAGGGLGSGRGSSDGSGSSASSNLGANLDLGAALRVGSGLSLPLGAAAGGSGAAAANNSQFLSYERRSLWGQCGYNCGYSYFGGLALGGAFGVFSGLRNAPNHKARILINSILNGSGKYGSRTGNAAGILALLYTVVERKLEDAEVERLPGWVNNLAGKDIFSRDRWDGVIPAAAAFTTGALFAVPRAVSMKNIDKLHVSPAKRIAVMGMWGLATTLGTAVLAVAGPAIFGDRSPFRLG